MQLDPRHGSNSVIQFVGLPVEILAPSIRQRRRLVSAVESFDDKRWAHPSRCNGWSNRDAIIHLDQTNSFWVQSITAGLRNSPTEILARFDPTKSPAQLVAAEGDLANAEVLERFVSSTESFVACLNSLDKDHWSLLAEAPPGHIDISAVVHHALWDSWVHERDIFIPLGLKLDEEADEVASGLRYAAALVSALAINNGLIEDVHLSIAATNPDFTFDLEVGMRVTVHNKSDNSEFDLEGDAVELIEVLSGRKPYSGPHESASWLVEQLEQLHA